MCYDHSSESVLISRLEIRLAQYWYWLGVQYGLLVGEIDFLTNLSKFYAFVQFFLFLVNISAIFWIRNGNPVNWTVLCLKVRFLNILYWYSMFFDLHQNWPKIFKIGQIGITFFSIFSLSEVIFDIRTDYINFLEILVNLPKIFKIDVFLSLKLLLFFFGPLTNVFYKYLFNSINPSSKKIHGWVSCRLN